MPYTASASHVHLIRTKCLACNVTRTIPSPPLRVEPGEEELATAASEESSMQEDSTPASVDPSTSRTISEDSGVQEEVSMTIDNSTGNEGAAPSGGGPYKANAASKDLHAKGKRKQKQPLQQRRRKRHADPIVPGTKKQYTHPRFHERPENAIIQVNNTA